MFLLATLDSIRGWVDPSVGLSIRPSVTRFFLDGQIRAIMNKNEISDDEAGRD